VKAFFIVSESLKRVLKAVSILLHGVLNLKFQLEVIYFQKNGGCGANR
jgi:hypothetical protein